MSDSHPQRYRQILPGPPRGDPTGSPSSTISVPKRPAVKTACEACRQRKAKCDQRRPECSPCLAAGRECVFAALPYELQAAATQRKHDELQSRMADHEDLYDTIRTGQPEEAEEIVRRIRAGGDVRSVTEDTIRGLCCCSWLRGLGSVVNCWVALSLGVPAKGLKLGVRTLLVRWHTLQGGKNKTALAILRGLD